MTSNPTNPLSYLASQDQSFYDELGLCCCISGVSVDLIVACRDHVHLAEQQILPKHTGGSIYLCNDLGTPYHNASLSQLHAYIQSLILEEHYFDCVMKLRISGNIGIESVCGSVSTNEDEDPVAALMTSHSTVEFCLDYPKYVEGETVFLQAAVLYPMFPHSTPSPPVTPPIRANAESECSTSVFRSPTRTRGYSRESTEAPWRCHWRAPLPSRRTRWPCRRSETTCRAP